MRHQKICCFGHRFDTEKTCKRPYLMDKIKLLNTFIFFERTCKSILEVLMATNLIKETEDIYSEKIKEMVNETLDILGHDEKVWQKKKNAIAMDISNCFNHLIIPNDILKKFLLQSSQRKQFKNIQIEILEELEQTLSNELEKVRIEQTECAKKLDNDIALLMQNLNQTTSFKYTNQENATFISNLYLDERLNYLKKILTNILPTNFSLRQYEQSIDELTKQGILTNNDLQKANTDLNNKKALLKQIYAIYDKIINLKYILSPSINPEKIFALGFVDSKLFSNAETLHRIVLRHTQLFKDMILELPSNLKQYFSLKDLLSQNIIFTDTTIESNKQLLNTDIFIYQRVSDLDNIYFSQNPKDGLYLYNSETFKSHWRSLRLVYKETRLLFPDIIPKKYTKTDIYINLIGNTNGEIAKLFAMSESKFSRLKNNAQKITPQWALLLEKFLDFNANFLKGSTTIPDLIYSDDSYLIPIVSISKRMKPGILYAFKEYLTDLQNELNQQNLNSDFSYLIQHLNLLIKNVDKLDEEHFKAIDLLLGFGIKDKKVIKK